MIATIKRIHGTALLKNFSCATDVPPFEKRNLVYGWNGKTIKESLRTTSSYANYNKRNYEKRCSEIASKDAEQKVLDPAEVSQLHAEREAKPKPDLVKLSDSFPEITILENKTEELLQQSASSKAIIELSKDPKLQQWCSAGLRLHQERETTKCLFCENEIPQARLDNLERHFDDSYRELQADLAKHATSLQKVSDSLDGIDIPAPGLIYDNLQKEFKQVATELKEDVASYKGHLATLIAAIREKQASIATVPKIARAEAGYPNELLTRINELIDKHNSKSKTLTADSLAAAKRLEAHYVTESLKEYTRLNGRVKTAEERKTRCNELLKRQEAQLEKIKASTVPHGMAAESLNSDLRRYLGRNEISFAVEGDGYRLVRRGQTDAKGLSEGERTAVALLYFLQTLRDQDFDLQSGTVVLDDPVSSLDANALFNAFSFIKEATQGAGQLIIFTHNFPFFRLVRRWFLGNRRKAKDCSLYSLKTQGTGHSRCCRLLPLDYLLRRFESEYHYLFGVIARAAGESDSSSVDLYHLPNTARRLLEAFISFYKPTASSSFEKALNELDRDQQRAGRIIRFAHAFSHNEDFDSSSEQDMSHLSETRSIMIDLLDFLKETAPDHFGEMEKLVQQANQSTSG